MNNLTVVVVFLSILILSTGGKHVTDFCKDCVPDLELSPVDNGPICGEADSRGNPLCASRADHVIATRDSLDSIYKGNYGYEKYVKYTASYY